MQDVKTPCTYGEYYSKLLHCVLFVNIIYQFYFIYIQLHVGYVDELMQEVAYSRLQFKTHKEAKCVRDGSVPFVPQPLTSSIANKVEQAEAVARHKSRFNKYK